MDEGGLIYCTSEVKFRHINSKNYLSYPNSSFYITLQNHSKKARNERSHLSVEAGYEMSEFSHDSLILTSLFSDPMRKLVQLAKITEV